jgi:NAD(P)-dependent dehydrogenase (short-subunit alcohol dehydrogenase family)
MLLWLLPLSFSPLVYFLLSRLTPRRQRIVPHSQERVLILGASTGIGRAIAHLYASRDAHVCIVGRRHDKLEAVRQECADLLPSGIHTKIIKLAEDFSDPEGLLRIRDALIQRMCDVFRTGFYPSLADPSSSSSAWNRMGRSGHAGGQRRCLSAAAAPLHRGREERQHWDGR